MTNFSTPQRSLRSTLRHQRADSSYAIQACWFPRAPHSAALRGIAAS